MNVDCKLTLFREPAKLKRLVVPAVDNFGVSSLRNDALIKEFEKKGFVNFIATKNP